MSFTKITSVFFSVLLLVLLAACGGGADSEPPSLADDNSGTGSDVAPPSPPANLKVDGEAQSNLVLITWDASTDNVGVSGYRVTRDDNLLIETTQLSYSDNQVSASQTYRYQVTAFDAAQNTASSTLMVNTPAEVPPADTEPPSEPANLRLVGDPSTTLVSLEWDASTDNVAVSGYRLMRSTNGEGAVSVSDGTALTYADNNVDASTDYRYQVFAYDLTGNEAASDLLNVSTPQPLNAVNDAFSTPYQTVLNGDLSINDSFSSSTSNTWILVEQAAAGNAVINNNGSFTYTPATNFSGNTSFTYQIRDSFDNLSNIATASVTVQAQQAATSCGTLYQDNGGFNPVTNRLAVGVSNLAKPAKGNHYLDPNYGTCVVRVSDHINDSTDIAGRIVPIYSRRQVFNADQSRMLLLAGNGFWHLYDANTYDYIRLVSLQGDNVEFQWHPTDPNLLYRMAFNGGRQIYIHDIRDSNDNTFSIAGDLTNVTSINGFPGVTDINDIWPNATRFSTGEEGSPSRDGRYWALMAMSNDFETQYGMIVYDLVTNSITGIYDYATNGSGSGNAIGAPNALSMSPSGTHLVAQWNPPACDGQNGRPSGNNGTLNNPCGTVAFNKDFTQATAISINGEHSDTATDLNGRDVYVGIEYQREGAIEIIDLETGSLVGIIDTNIFSALHISGRAVDKPGWVVISHYEENESSQGKWYSQEVFLAKIAPNPVIVRLAKHRSNAGDYWAQPHATINRDATKILWGSNWGGSTLDLDSYMVTIPAGALDNL